MKTISIVLATIILASNVQGKILAVPIVGQEQGNWCWLGSTDAVMRYVGFKNPTTKKTYRQCEILQWFENNKIPWANNTFDVCAHPEKFNHGGYLSNIRDIINHYSAISTNISVDADDPISREPTYDEIKTQIDHYGPMIRRIDWSHSDKAHATVVKGYTENNGNKIVVIMDPGNKGGINISTYDDVVENSSGKWTKTLMIHTSIHDKDDDGIFDYSDNCLNINNPKQEDKDGDGIGDICDNCPSIVNVNQIDIDNDKIGDKCDSDIDNDTIPNSKDNCKYIPNKNQEDVDNDKIGDKCDNCKTKSNAQQIDNDCDGIGDVCDNEKNVFGCTGKTWIYDNRLWKIIHPLDPITNIKIIPYMPTDSLNIRTDLETENNLNNNLR